jgi:hypothetical protein
MSINLSKFRDAMIVYFPNLINDNEWEIFLDNIIPVENVSQSTQLYSKL